MTHKRKGGMQVEYQNSRQDLLFSYQLHCAYVYTQILLYIHAHVDLPTL